MCIRDRDGILAWDNHAPRQKQIVGIPVFISEYGGIKWDVEGDVYKRQVHRRRNKILPDGAGG